MPYAVDHELRGTGKLRNEFLIVNFHSLEAGFSPDDRVLRYRVPVGRRTVATTRQCPYLLCSRIKISRRCDGHHRSPHLQHDTWSRTACLPLAGNEEVLSDRFSRCLLKFGSRSVIDPTNQSSGKPSKKGESARKQPYGPGRVDRVLKSLDGFSHTNTLRIQQDPRRSEIPHCSALVDHTTPRRMELL